MTGLRNRHPGAVCAVFLCVLLPVMFGLNPVTSGIGLCSGLLYFCLLEEKIPWRTLIFYPGLVLFSGAVNPVFNHNGRTVLFFLNRNPVTLESILYGLVMGMLIASALIWARCFTRVMDTERLLEVLGGLSPKVSLILSMALRYIPLFREQAARIREARTGLGLIREENGLDRLKGGLQVMDGMVTWGLENGIVTADSMAARGYGSGRRTRYRTWPWERGDTLLTLWSLLLLGAVSAARAAGRIGYTWYPELKVPPAGPVSLMAYAAFGLLCVTASLLEIKDVWTWKSLRSKI